MTLNEKESRTGTTPTGPRPLRVDLDPASQRECEDYRPDPEERRIVDAARDGDADAFRFLVEQHSPSIYRLAMRVLNSDRASAEDLCQEVFLRAFRGLQGFDGEVRFGAWLHKIGLNACISEYRKRRTLKRSNSRATLSIDAPIQGNEDLHIEPPSQEVDPGSRADQMEFATAVRAAIPKLPDEFRDAVLLRDMQGLGYEEISEVLGVPPGTVRSRIHRGRLLLQKMLGGFAP